jgi:hypothetical protein
LNRKNQDLKSSHQHQNASKNQKFEILLKPFEKKSENAEKKTENAVDDLQVYTNNKNVLANAKTKTHPDKEYNTISLSKENNKSKIFTNVQFNDKPTKKTIGKNNINMLLEGSHRLFNHK